MKKNFALLIVTLILSLLVVELFFRIFYPINMQSWYAERISEKNFVVNKKNYIHKIERWNWKYYAKYTFGKYRNRTTQPMEDKKDKILILGDSFTFGLYLKDKDTYINKLQNKFNEYNLINSSVPGWSLEDYYLFTKNFCKIVNPKKIIVILNDGDLGRIRQPAIIERSKSLKEKYLFYRILIENVMTFAFLRDKIYELYKNINIKNKIQKIEQSEKKFEGTAIEFKPDIAKLIISDAKRIFLDLKLVSNDCNALLYIINLGWIKEENDDVIKKYPKLLFIKNEKDFFKNNVINFYDNTNFLQDVHFNKEKFIIKNEGHPNELGAEKIFQSLSVHFNEILK